MRDTHNGGKNDYKGKTHLKINFGLLRKMVNELAHYPNKKTKDTCIVVHRHRLFYRYKGFNNYIGGLSFDKATRDGSKVVKEIHGQISVYL